MLFLTSISSFDSIKYRNNLRMHSISNEQEIEAVRSSYASNMCTALRYHAKCLSVGSQHDLVSVFRLVSIWFDNETNADVTQIINVSATHYYACTLH